jgi:hypothetical protein
MAPHTPPCTGFFLFVLVYTAVYIHTLLLKGDQDYVQVFMLHNGFILRKG